MRALLRLLTTTLVGGVLTEYLDWRWCMFVNVPIGLAVLPLAATRLRDSALHRSMLI